LIVLAACGRYFWVAWRRRMCLCGIALWKEGGGFEVTTFARTRFNVTLYVYCLYQGRIKLFGAPRQWKHFRPLFQAVLLSRGGVLPSPPDWVKDNSSQSQDRNNKYFVLYIEFVAADLLSRLERMRHAWKGDCYLTVLVFSWQILFLIS